MDDIEKNKIEESNEKIKKENPYNDYEEVKKINARRKRNIFIIILIIFILVILAIFSTIFSLLNINNENIMTGVSVNNIDISGLSKDEAKAKVENVLDEKINKEIKVIYGEYESTINPKVIDAKFDTNKAIEDAYGIGRNGNIIINNYNILFSLIGKKDIETKVIINEEETEKLIKDIGANLPGALVETSYYIEDSNLIITKGKEGLVVNSEKLLELIYEKLNNKNINQEYIEIPVEVRKPEEINLQKIHDEIYKEPQNAYYNKEPFEIHAEVDGVDFNIEEAKQIISSEEKEEYTIPLKITKPEITINKIGTEAFPNLLSTFTTKYDKTNTNRTTNLQLAINKINGVVLMPDEEFSYNKIVGERTISAGYKEAKIYSNGEVVDGLGGGICQISSTLYNTVLLANLEITERRNHQFVTSYLPAGRDATVVYGSQDFKFKNNRKYPVKIEASLNSGIAKISLYGVKEENDYTVTFETRTVSAIPYKTKYINDSTIEEGTEKIQQKGVNGLITETYKILNLNGVVVSKTLLSKDTYNAMQRVVLKGTKKVKKSQDNNENKQDKENENKTNDKNDKDNNKEN